MYFVSDVSTKQKEEILSVMAMVQGTFTSPDEELADDSPDYVDDDIQEIRRRLLSCCPQLTDSALASKSLLLYDYYMTII